MCNSIHTFNQSVSSLPRELSQIPTYLDDIQKAILGVSPNNANYTVSPAPSAPLLSDLLPPSLPAPSAPSFPAPSAPSFPGLM